MFEITAKLQHARFLLMSRRWIVYACWLALATGLGLFVSTFFAVESLSLNGALCFLLTSVLLAGLITLIRAPSLARVARLLDNAHQTEDRWSVGLSIALKKLPTEGDDLALAKCKKWLQHASLDIPTPRLRWVWLWPVPWVATLTILAVVSDVKPEMVQEIQEFPIQEVATQLATKTAALIPNQSENELFQSKQPAEWLRDLQSLERQLEQNLDAQLTMESPQAVAETLAGLTSAYPEMSELSAALLSGDLASAQEQLQSIDVPWNHAMLNSQLSASESPGHIKRFLQTQLARIDAQGGWQEPEGRELLQQLLDQLSQPAKQASDDTEEMISLARDLREHIDQLRQSQRPSRSEDPDLLDDDPDPAIAEQEIPDPAADQPTTPRPERWLADFVAEYIRAEPQARTSQEAVAFAASQAQLTAQREDLPLHQREMIRRYFERLTQSLHE
ncbi:MAG: hypothetical protein ACFCU3_00160 [Verrucomicrobiales bacterium]